MKLRRPKWLRLSTRMLVRDRVQILHDLGCVLRLHLLFFPNVCLRRMLHWRR